MPNPFRELFFGTDTRTLLLAVTPRRTFADVVLPPSTREALEHALTQIRKHDVIFGEWGLGERHQTGLSLAFNFAGPPGTGKTICAEAVAHALGKKLLVVRYDELESQWAGATAKNVSSVFDAAAREDAVLFFDEADAIASRRFTAMDQGYQREANAVVNVLLRELESFPGVVVFATNLAANLDPAFERRIRTHILFEAPGPDERERIWAVQLHERRTPLAPDVDFRALAERYPVTGGDIKNAVLKAAQIAVSEPGPDGEKAIAQRHFEAGIRAVLDARRVMDQTLFSTAGAAGLQAADALDAPDPDELTVLAERLVEVEDSLPPLQDAVRKLQAEAVEARDGAQVAAAEARRRWVVTLGILAAAGLLMAVAVGLVALL